MGKQAVLSRFENNKFDTKAAKGPNNTPLSLSSVAAIFNRKIAHGENLASFREGNGDRATSGDLYFNARFLRIKDAFAARNSKMGRLDDAIIPESHPAQRGRKEKRD